MRLVTQHCGIPWDDVILKVRCRGYLCGSCHAVKTAQQGSHASHPVVVCVPMCVLTAEQQPARRRSMVPATTLGGKSA